MSRFYLILLLYFNLNYFTLPYFTVDDMHVYISYFPDLYFILFYGGCHTFINRDISQICVYFFILFF